MAGPVFTSRARIRARQADIFLKCYAQRRAPKDTAKACGLSLNTTYIQYERIRWRLIMAGYYSDGANSIDEAGLGVDVIKALRERRGIGNSDIYPHAAEAIHWAQEYPSGLGLKHLRKIIELTGPLDAPPVLTEPEAEKLDAYVRYARTELVYNRAKSLAEKDAMREPFAERVKVALESEWRAYRAASKCVERSWR